MQAGERPSFPGSAAPFTVDHARALLDGITDPEIPDLTIAEIGILRDIDVNEAECAVTVTITPTYSGCPAMATIRLQIRDMLLRAGYRSVDVRSALAPAWTTDWIHPTAREKLRRLGIAPPVGPAGPDGDIDPSVACPRCGSRDTRCLSRFGSTACKALYCCDTCREPFEYFKCI